jgi:hypothetical protein
MAETNRIVSQEEDAQCEHLVLTTCAGRALLDEVAKVGTPTPADLMRWRKDAPADQVAAAVRLVAARRRGATKFDRAAAMWLEATGLEQATAEAVARHKATRFAGTTVVDLCSGIGGDALALAARAESVIAVDRSYGMCRRLLWNAAAYEVAARILAVRADAKRFSIPPGALVHIDPDRRDCGPRRAVKLEQYTPSLAFLERLIRSCPGGALKLGPASDFDLHFRRADHEVELVSLRGECKEATLWFGTLATCRRRATALPTGATWCDRDGPTHPACPVEAPRAWIFDPDPALIRAGLLDSVATAYGLARVSGGVDFLTGSTPVDSPFLAGFLVESTMPLDRKRLRALVRERGLGPLEIKIRGVDIRPEQLRGELRPGTHNPATLILYTSESGARAILAHREPRRTLDSPDNSAP